MDSIVDFLLISLLIEAGYKLGVDMEIPMGWLQCSARAHERAISLLWRGILAAIVITLTLSIFAPANVLAEDSTGIFYVSPTVGPGETALFEGVGIGDATSAHVMRLSDEVTARPSIDSGTLSLHNLDFSQAVSAPILQGTRSSAKLTIPSQLPSGLFA